METEKAFAIMQKYVAREKERCRDKEALHQYLKDQTIPLEERAQIFDHMPETVQTIESWVFTPKKYNEKYGELEWFENYVWERRDTVMFENVEISMSENEEEDWEARVALLKEDFIDAGIHGFVFDW